LRLTPATFAPWQQDRKEEFTVSITYTNRKGWTYYLCQGTTKTGKPRYYFAREPKDELLDEIPQGWEISESVNGIVSLVKKRPAQILPKEVEAVEAAVKRHPKSHNYRVNVRHDRIEIYESTGPDADELLSHLGRTGMLFGGREQEMREVLAQDAQFTPVMRFILADRAERTFRAERWCYLGSIDDWIFVDAGPVAKLARRMIPTLGTDAFYELF
jgi:hypothetical protein